MNSYLEDPPTHASACGACFPAARFHANSWPTISDACGAADLIRHGISRFVIPSADVGALRSAILAFAGKSSTERQGMSAAATAMGEALHPQVAARYLLEFVRHSLAGGDRPSAPWLLAREATPSKTGCDSDRSDR